MLLRNQLLAVLCTPLLLETTELVRASNAVSRYTYRCTYILTYIISYSPARTPTAVTVGATDNTDKRASYSNFGTCTTIFAPGSSITSSWIGSSNTATNVWFAIFLCA